MREEKLDSVLERVRASAPALHELLRELPENVRPGNKPNPKEGWYDWGDKGADPAPWADHDPADPSE